MSNDRTYAGAISGTGNLIKNGTRTQTLSGCSSSYTGTTTINAGILQVSCLANGGSNSAIGAAGTAASNLVLNGGTLQYSGAAGSTNRLFTLGSSGGTIASSGTGALAFTNAGAVGFSGAGNRTLTLDGTTPTSIANTFAPQITNNGAAVTSLTKAGTNTWILTNSNSTYTGVTRIDGGVLGVDKLSDGNQASSIGASSIAASNLVIGNNSTLRYTGAGDNTNRLFTMAAGVTFIESAGTGAIAFTNTGSMGFDGSGARVLALGGSNTGNNILGLSLINGTGGTTTVAKNDAGTWILTGASPYTGGTNVNAGTLIVNGSLGNTAMNVASGGTLGGAGTIAGTMNVNGGGTLAPGATPGATGVLATGALTLNAGSLLAYDLGAPNVVGGAQNDLVNVTGNLTLAGTLNVTDAGSFAATPGSYRLFNYTGALTNNGLTLGTTPGYAPGEAVVQTVVPGAVNLIVSSGMNVAWWDGAGAIDDGAIAGGTQTWNGAAGNWTNANGVVNQSWLDGMAIFTGNAGAVTLGANVQARALQFQTTGYTIGGGFTLQMNQLPNGGAPLIRVDPGVTATINASIVGSNGLEKWDAGTLVLGGTHTYTGTTTVTAGTLQVTGTIANSAVVVHSGATLGGTGTIAGVVTINAGGALAPGMSPGTLTVGELHLSAGSILNYELGPPFVVGGGVNDLVEIAGDLTLDGLLNVTDIGGFNLGVYRLMNYGGTLTDNTLDFGTMPAGFAYQVQSGTGQVNLIVSSDVPNAILFWDGTDMIADGVIDGGTAVWNAANTNWTDAAGVSNTAWGSQFAVFSGAAGTVTVEGPQTFTGMQFLTDGYAIVAGAGGALHTDTALTPMRVDAGLTATIAAPITGTGSLELIDPGTLVLAGINTYTGGTTVTAGVLSISADANLGAVTGALTLNGGTLQTTASFHERPSCHDHHEPRHHRHGGGDDAHDGRHRGRRRADEDGRRHARADRGEQLRRRHDDQRRHAADWQRGLGRVGCGQCREQRGARVQSQRRRGVRRDVVGRRQPGQGGHGRADAHGRESVLRHHRRDGRVAIREWIAGGLDDHRRGRRHDRGQRHDRRSGSAGGRDDCPGRRAKHRRHAHDRIADARQRLDPGLRPRRPEHHRWCVERSAHCQRQPDARRHTERQRRRRVCVDAWQLSPDELLGHADRRSGQHHVRHAAGLRPR